MFAILENLGFVELVVVLGAALLIFGKRLPEVASQAGSTIAKFRRSIDNLREETGIDRDLRQARRDIEGVLPRNLSIGEMARIASVEVEKRIKATEAESAAPEAASTGPEAASTDAAALADGRAADDEDFLPAGGPPYTAPRPFARDPLPADAPAEVGAELPAAPPGNAPPTSR